jgi:hypothetical protein
MPYAEKVSTWLVVCLSVMLQRSMYTRTFVRSLVMVDVLQCSEWVKQALPAMAKVTAICEKEEYGTYHPGRRRGRCNELDIYDISRQMAPACCGDKGQYCRSPATSQVGYNK